MEYIAITRETCAWLLVQPGVLSALTDALLNKDLSELARTNFSAGPLRMAGGGDKRLLAIWNSDYLSGTGSESWGIFRLQGAMGIRSHLDIGPQVIERLIYVSSQRLQGLMIEGDFIHRTWPNGSHTCLAGRGSEARHYSIAYFEGGPGFGTLSARALIAIGPEHDFDALQRAIENEVPRLSVLSDQANGLVDKRARRPALEAANFTVLRAALTANQPRSTYLENVTVETANVQAETVFNPYETLHWSYKDWVTKGALNEAQKRALGTDVLREHPIRIIGPAGSGKTLLMQLLAMRYLTEAQGPLRIAYLVHNAAMAQMVTDRFKQLGGEEYLTSPTRSLLVTTLAEYGRQQIGIDDQAVIDRDAQKTKAFQFEQVREALQEVLNEQPKLLGESRLLEQVWKQPDLFTAFAALVMAEISSVIKGMGLVSERDRYVNAEVPLSRFHRLLNQEERAAVFDCFSKYHHAVFEEFGLLDSDDIALSLAGRLRTPVWQLRRKEQGFDIVLVDEAQLFNENERRIFPLLSKGTTNHVPIALALDEAQEPFGFSSAGLATLGIKDVENENLPSNHRSTKEIVDLAFFVIQRTTDLFGADFPEFTDSETATVSSQHPLASPPVLIRRGDEQSSFGRFILKTVTKLRAKNVRQIAVVCHAETYWNDIEAVLTGSQLPLHVISQRGEKIAPDQPLVILSRPAYIGGQEFDAVILVGLEQGVVPPRVVDNPALAAALEQQVLREVYLSISRSRFRVIVALNTAATPNSVVTDALEAGFISEGTVQ